ncbi:RAMP superfamily CRISPR-associated protein [Rhodospirillum sp. A1_3_36]|uniref:RAMP superfamily CRISPR-associated protein n=1 Tax=Rhodospirillum sp. A1_3_36 TaxID=3391666 RepID=UPI0039A4A7E1
MRHRYTLSLTLRGPVMATGLDAPEYGIDAPFLRDHENRLCLPGSQLRGVLRHTIAAMVESGCNSLPDTAEADWFGRASGQVDTDAFERNDAAVWEPRKRRVHVSDLYPPVEPETRFDRLTRVRIDGATGAVAEGALQVLECPIGVNERVPFSGTIVIEAPSAEEAESIAIWLRRALALVPAIGAHKTAGFGHVEAATLEAAPKPAPAAPDSTTKPSVKTKVDGWAAASLVLTFDGPFLVSADRWNGNSFRGTEDVSGAVLKAALAPALTEAGVDPETLSRAIFQEARPARPEAKRPTVAPLSLYWAETLGSLEDALEIPPESLGDLISFHTDWKEGSAAQAALSARTGRTFEALRSIRTRTRIGKQGTVEPGHLFTYAAVNPLDHVWKGRILPGDLATEAFATLLNALPDRLTGIGKTRVSASLALEETEIPKPVEAEKEGATLRVRVVLQTPALLHGPQCLATFSEIADPAERLRHQYEAYFSHALSQRSEGTAPDAPTPLRLVAHASQRRVGGYLAGRYRQRERGYQPWILTNPGSVFEFTLDRTRTLALNSFAGRGLPPPKAEIPLSDWRINPFVPQNGFGEVLVEPGLS